MTDKKLNEVYYHPDDFSTGSKSIKRLHKFMLIPIKEVRSWLAKQAL